jgi:hypothetical protein
MFNFLRSDKPESTMRVNVTLIVIGCLIILLAVAFHIIWFSLKLNNNILWSQIALLFPGLATIITGALWQKTSQKRIENNSPLNVSNMATNVQLPDPPDTPGPGDGTGTK